MNQQTGKYIILFGILIVVVGLVVYFLGNKFHWIGRLPGDIRIEGESSRFYVPLTSMILFSILLTIIVNLIKRFL